MRASWSIARRSSRKRPLTHCQQSSFGTGLCLTRANSSESLHAFRTWNVSRNDHRLYWRLIQPHHYFSPRNFASSPADSTTQHNLQSRQHRPRGKSSTLEQKWNRTRYAILTARTIQPSDVEDAQYLIQSLRINPNLATQKRIEECFSILEKLCRNSCHSMDQASLGALLTAWRDHAFSLVTKASIDVGRRNHANFLQEPLTCHSVMQTVKRCFETQLVEPFDMPLSIVLHVMAKVEDPRRSPFLGEQLFHDFVRNGVQPGRASIYGMVELWARSSLKESAAKAEYYLDQIQVVYQTSGRTDDETRPTAGIFCAVMEAHSRSSNPSQAIARIKELYSIMKETVPIHEMDTVTYSRVCHALAACEHRYAADEARVVLDEMCEALLLQTRNHESNLPPNSRHNYGNASNTELSKSKSMQHAFTDVITVYARDGRVKEAEELFHYMWELAEKTGKKSVQPDVGAFNALLWAYAKTGQQDQADSILVKMTESTNMGQTGVESNWQTWNGVLASWADSGDREAPTRIGNLIKRLMKMEEVRGQVGEIVRVNAWNKLLACHARQGNADQAEKLFNLLENQNQSHLHPDSESHYSMTVAWSNAGNPQKSESYLRVLCDKVKSGQISHSTLDHRHFNIAMEAWSKSRLPEAPEKATAIFRLMESLDIQADQYDYNSLIWAWGNSFTTADPSKPVEEIYRRMTNQWKGGDDRTKPTEITILALITAIGRSRNTRALERIHNTVFSQTEELDITPTSRLYNALMTAWSRQNRADKVEALFREMKAGFEKGQTSLQPHFKAHTTRLQAWSKAGKPIEASNALRDMVEAHYSGIIEEKPTTITFNAVIQAWLRSNLPDSAEKAEAGLHKMIQLAEEKKFNCRPDVVSFTSVISAYAKSGLPNAADKAYELFVHLRQQSARADRRSKHDNPSLITYAETIVALCRHPSSESEERVLELLQEVTRKDAHFWRENQSNLHMLQKAKRAIKSSSLGSRESLSNALGQVLQ